MTLRVRPEARADILDATHWYEGRQGGLGSHLVAEIDAVLRRIEQGPKRFRKAHGELRIALIHRFPYAVYFSEQAGDIVVFAVLHQRRDRAVLDERVQDSNG